MLISFKLNFITYKIEKVFVNLFKYLYQFNYIRNSY